MRKRQRLLAMLFAILLIATSVIPMRTQKASAKPGENYNPGDFVTFGSYPQTQVTDAALIAKLKSEVSGKTFTGYPYTSQNTAFDYQYGQTRMVRNTNMMSYCDFNYNGKKYRAVKITKFRPAYSWGAPGANSRQSLAGFSEGSTYFFEWKPIDWIVLDPDEGFLLSYRSLDAQAFCEWFLYGTYGWEMSSKDTSKPAYDYFYATIRDWLTKPADVRSPYNNYNFLDTAFTAEELQAIKNTTLKSDYDNCTFPNKVFLLSEDEFTQYKSVIGVVPNFDLATAYSLSQGTGKANYWTLRSKATKEPRILVCHGSNTTDSDSDFASLNSCLSGIRPAVKVDLTSSVVAKKKLAPEFSMITGGNELFRNTVSGKPKVSWQQAEGATRYQVLYYDVTSGSAPSDRSSWKECKNGSINAGATLEYIHTDAQINHSYVYAVRAYGSSWTGDSTNYLSRDCKLEMPDVTKYTINRDYTADVAWKPVSGASAYTCEVSYGSSWTKIANPSANTTTTLYTAKVDGQWMSPGDSLQIRVIAKSGVNSKYDSIPTYSSKTVPNPCWLVFDLDGGEGNTPTMLGFAGDTFTIPSFSAKDAPKRRGYYFLGWSGNPGATEAVVKSGDTVGPVEYRAVLYAVWKIRNYTITYNLDGGTNNSANPSKYTVESPAIYLKPATKAGYRFDGWYTDAAKTKKSSGIAPDSIGDRTFYAKFTKMADVKFSFSRNGGTGNAPTAQTVKYGTTVTIPKIYPTREGYYYLGWSTNKNATAAQYKGGDKITVTENTVLHAVWKPRTNTITFNANGGSGTLPATIKVLSGKTATIGSSSMSRNGYWFLGWSASKTATTATYKTGSEIGVTKDTVLYAVWKKK
ncbi:MAG: InlB B-repeat-containing protein [Lachnospiraceae bacterium]|nr:InlB B-repeat-containing protein [Lachnospiraceae bacterium]